MDFFCQRRLKATTFTGATDSFSPHRQQLEWYITTLIKVSALLAISGGCRLVLVRASVPVVQRE